MSGGGGSTTTQSSDPWSGIQPFLIGGSNVVNNDLGQLKDSRWGGVANGGTTNSDAYGLYPAASDLAKQGPLPYYPGQTYAGFNPLQVMGQQGALNFADSLNSQYSGLTGAQSSLMSGVNPLTQSLQQNLGGASGAYQDVLNRTGYGPLWGAMGDTAATQALASQYNQNPLATQSGQNLLAMQTPQGNPYLDQMVDTAQNKTIENFQQNYLPGILAEAQGSGQGVGDSGYYKALMKGSQSLVDRMGDIATNMYGSAYNQDMNRALGAQQAGLGFESSAAGRGLQAAGMGAGFEQGQGQFGVGAQQALDAAQMGAAGNIFGSYGSGLNLAQSGQLSAMGLSPMINQMGMMPSNIYQQIGAQQQAMEQQGIDQAMQQYYYPQQSQQDMLNWYAGILSGAGGLGGTSSTTTQNDPNTMAQILGLGTTLGGMYMMGGM